MLRRLYVYKDICMPIFHIHLQCCDQAKICLMLQEGMRFTALLKDVFRFKGTHF